MSPFDNLLQIRYHHDGKYNVMSLDGPFEIFGTSSGQLLTHWSTDLRRIFVPS